MKKYFVIVILLAAATLQAQRKPKIKGNKSVIEVGEDLPAFNAIELNDDLEIFVQKASSEGYVLTADDNLVDVLKFRVVDSTLVISSFYTITSKRKLDITINYVEINSLILRDGRMRMKDIIDTDALEVTTFGSSKLELNANASTMNIVMDENSSGDFNLESDELNMTLKDRIDVRIYAVADRLVMNMQDNASAKMDGTSNGLQANLSGGASLKAEKLQADEVSAHLEGSSSAKIYANKLLELSSKGSSKTYLSGDGKIEIIDFLDTSELHKEK